MKNSILSEQEIQEIQNRNADKRSQEQQDAHHALECKSLLLQTFTEFARMAKEYPATAMQCGIPPQVYKLFKMSFFTPSKSKPLYNLGIEIQRQTTFSYTHYRLHVSEKGDLYEVREASGSHGAPDYIVSPFTLKNAERLFERFPENTYCDFVRIIAGMCFRQIPHVYEAKEIAYYRPSSADEIHSKLQNLFKGLLKRQ